MEKFLIGCFTDSKSASKNYVGKGISVLSLDKKNGLLIEEALHDIENPGYLNLDKMHNKLYVCIERSSEVGEIAILDSNTFEVESQFTSFGLSTCYICYDEVKNRILWTNYTSGDMASYDLLTKESHYLKLEGSSINEERQKSPHPHFVGFYKDTILVTDLGCDCIHVLDRKSNELDIIEDIETPKGYGPRHFIIENDTMYVLCELKAKLLVYTYDNNKSTWNLVQEIDTESPDLFDIAAPAAIKRSGDVITVSNRFSDTLRQFRIEKDGCSVINTLKLEGKNPRDFNYSKNGDFILVALQDTNSIELYSVNSEGLLDSKPLSVFTTGTPVCVKNYN